MMEISLIPSNTNVNFPPTKDNPLGGLHVVYDETLNNVLLPTLYDQSAKLKSLILKAKTMKELRAVFDKFEKESLADILNYINSPICDFLFKNRNVESIQLLLYLAVGKASLETIKYLVSLGADVRAQNDWAVRHASSNGHLETVKYLVGQGANIRVLNDTAVCLASYNGHLETVKYLVEQGADVRAQNDVSICLASEKGHLETVKYLVEQGADVRAQNDTAVRCASANGRLETVKYLVGQGANVRAQNDMAVYYASFNGHPETVKYLVSLGANPGVRTTTHFD